MTEFYEHDESELGVLKSKIRPYLVQYLDKKGIQVDAQGRIWIRCISPYHEDEEPSMHLHPDSDGEILKCFGCGEAVDIFTAHAYLDGAPLEDAEFVYENVYVLADMFGIKYEEVNFTREQLEQMKARRLMRDAAIVFQEMVEGQWSAYRGWDPEEVKKYGVGTIRDPAAFYQAVEARGRHTHKFMVMQGLQHHKEFNKTRLFGSDRLTFLIRDHKGHPVGFACRNYNTEQPDPKYLNTPQRSEKRKVGSTIYKKEEVLYGLDHCRQAKNKRLDVFEGYADWITARLAGHRNCVAMCGTAFTSSHVELLVDMGFKHINFVMDDDETGRKKMIGDPHDPKKKGYLFRGKGIPDLKITVGFLPFDDDEKEERDPDAWLLKHTIEEYEKRIEIFDAFRWQLKLYKEEGTWSPEDILENLIGYLHNEENLVLRREKVEQLSAATGFDSDSILAEYERRFNLETNRLITKTMSRLERTYSTSEKVDLVKHLVEDLESHGHKDKSDASQDEVIRDFLNFSEWTERDDLSLAGWDCGFELMNQAMNGIPKDGQWVGFAGNANCGKSALVLAMGLGLVRNNPKGLSVLYWSLDDPRHVSYMKWLAAMTSEHINQCGQAKKFIFRDPERKKRFIEAKEELLVYLDEKRLSVKGEEYGNITPLLTRWIDSIQQETGNHCVVVIDSFNNVEFQAQDEFTAQRKLSKWMRSQTQKYGFTIISTLECNKLGIVEKRPRLGHLYGAAKLGFDLKFIGMVYNDLHENREEASTIWLDENGRPKPYIEVSVEKNKLSAFKDELAYKFHPARAMVNEVDPKTVISLRDGVVEDHSWEGKKGQVSIEDSWEEGEYEFGDPEDDDLWTS